MQQRSEDTHERIKSTAMRLFAQNGYDRTGVAEICQASYLSKGAFYHHFPSKQALFLELLQEWMTSLESEFSQILARANSVPDGLLEMTGTLQNVFDAADGHLPLFLEFWTQAYRDETIWNATIEPYRRYQHFFARLLEHGVREGSLRPLDSELGARIIVSFAVGVLVQGLLDPKSAAWDQIGRSGVKTILNGLQEMKK